MNIHEYQAKALLHEFGVPISRGEPVLKASDSDAAAKKLPGPVWVDGDTLLVAREDRGRVGLLRVAADGSVHNVQV